MSSRLTLFRSTGYSTYFGGAEARRTAVHPGWMVAAISAWIGFACNVSLWREVGSLSAETVHGLVRALALGAFIAADCAVVLSIFGWQKTLKPVATLLLFGAALSAVAIWGQALPIDASLADHDVTALLLPPWASLLHWQVTALLVSLAIVPTVWVWNTRVKRLPGPQQLNINVIATLVSCAVIAMSGVLLSRGLA
jgi:glucan phosphoethanolaminetransferase (alkaline phosphatase superfamily)